MNKRKNIQPINYFRRVLLLLGVVWLASACGPTKYLDRNEVLYTGAGIEIQSEENIQDKSGLKNKLEETVYPEPNAKFLWLFRTRLWFYNITGDVDKEKGFKYWLKYKIGEAPVLLEDVDAENVKKLMTNRLYNRGHFKPLVNHNIELKNKKAEIKYIAEINPAYVIDSVAYPPDTGHLMKTIINSKKESFLGGGQVYKLENIRKERQRIQELLLNNGYYFFMSDFIYYQVDSTVGNREVKLYFRLKDDIPENALLQFKVEEVYLYPNYSLEDSSWAACPDTFESNNIQYIKCGYKFRRDEITRGVFLRPGKMYSREDHQKTLSRLIGLDIFKFVNVRFEQIGKWEGIGRLYAYIYLTPEKIHALTAELKGIAKSNNFIGPGLELSYTNRNLFRGAELFIISSNLSWETQIGGQQKDLNSYEFGINARLQYPRLETPFNIDNRQSRFVPKTNIDVGYNFIDRVKYYAAHSLSFGLGYTWKENIRKTHEFTALNLEYFQLGKTTENFREIVDNNAYLESSFEDQFIIGPGYRWTYSDQSVEELRHHIFFTAATELSGLITEQILKGVNSLQKHDIRPNRMFGIRYAQFVKLESDLRFYQNMDEQNQLAYRLFIGTGFPFGNSQTLPYSKQFYAGGTNDIRAFRARELGPGSYHPPDSVGRVFVEQTGDIKLEANMEYRFDIVSFLEGAVFVDAGNVWLNNKSEERPGAQFRFNSFYKQIAVGTGLGLRADFSFLIFRLDLAFPLRKPYLPEGERWVIGDIYGYDGWGRENLVLNIAIGYPF